MRYAPALAAVCLACTSPAWAGALTLNAGYQQEREVDTHLAATGYGVGVSIDLGRYAFFGVNYSNLRTESFEDAIDGTRGRLEYRSGGPQLGFVWPWTHAIGLTITGGYAESSTRGLDAFAHDRVERSDGATGSLSVWYAPDPKVAFSAGGGYSYIGARPGWDTSAGVGLRLWRELWLDSGYWRGAGAGGFTVGLRTSFTDG